MTRMFGPAASSSAIGRGDEERHRVDAGEHRERDSDARHHADAAARRRNGEIQLATRPPPPERPAEHQREDERCVLP